MDVTVSYEKSVVDLCIHMGTRLPGSTSFTIAIDTTSSGTPDGGKSSGDTGGKELMVETIEEEWPEVELYTSGSPRRRTTVNGVEAG